MTFYAVGNTWDANVQTADATGIFPTGKSLVALQGGPVSPAAVAGQSANVRLFGSGTGGTLTLAVGL
ncbi:MAG TPA: hypothetical protein VGF76_10070 [Polyangiaceae bacterium]